MRQWNSSSGEINRWEYLSWSIVSQLETHFVVIFKVFSWPHKVKYFRQAFISSLGIDRGCLKFLANDLNALPNDLLFPHKYYNNRSRVSRDFLRGIVHSSKSISFHLRNTFPVPDALDRRSFARRNFNDLYAHW